MPNIIQEEANEEENFDCPITAASMENDAVSTHCGHSFGNAAIREWIARSRFFAARCPMCRDPITAAELVPNLGLRQRIRDARIQAEGPVVAPVAAPVVAPVAAPVVVPVAVPVVVPVAVPAPAPVVEPRPAPIIFVAPRAPVAPPPVDVRPEPLPMPILVVESAGAARIRHYTR